MSVHPSDTSTSNFKHSQITQSLVKKKKKIKSHWWNSAIKLPMFQGKIVDQTGLAITGNKRYGGLLFVGGWRNFHN